jgi:hypothetical protein
MALINGLDHGLFINFEKKKYDLAVLEWESVDDLLRDSKMKVLLYFFDRNLFLYLKIGKLQD